MNRVRHELELRLKAEKEANEELTKTLNQKLEIINDRDYKIDYLEINRKELERKIEELRDQVRQTEKLAEIKINSLNDKIEALNESISTEKDLREIWIEKFE